MKKKKKIFIIHFHPLELYPPVMNMIDYLSLNSDCTLIVVTNKKLKTNPLLQYEPGANVKIYRPATQATTSFTNYINYFFFYIASFYLLLKYNPKIVFYFETLSSWPALIYKKLKGKQVMLMVHYHEYTEPKLYKEGMLLARWMNRRESKMYKNYSWISHTNPVRLRMFKDDNDLNNMPGSVFHVIPNYPPKSWDINTKKYFSKNKMKRLVFVGSLGYDNMYLQEVITWLNNHREEFSLDVYSYNIDDKAKEALENKGSNNIRYCGGCDYQALPGVLKNYDIGLVIYKPFSQNTIHAVSNKVFEYLALGLDVWFSDDMIYTFEYVRKDTYPKVIPVDFKQLSSFDYASAIAKVNLSFQPVTFFYESVYPEILNHFSHDEINGEI